MKNTMSIKERKFLDAYLDSGNLITAVHAAGYKCKRENARKTGREILKRLKPSIDDMLEYMGLSDPILFRKISEGLDAMDTKIATHMGEIKDTMDVVDYATRARYIEILVKIKGLYKERVELTGKGETPVFGPLSDSLTSMVQTILENK